MTSSLRAYRLSNPEEHIQRASNTQSFQTLISEMRDHVGQMEESDQSAIRLLDSANEEEAIRTEHTFRVTAEDEYQSATADIQVLINDQENIEGVGYLRNGHRLLVEFSTTEATAPDCQVEKFNGEIILEGRDFEPEEKLP